MTPRSLKPKPFAAGQRRRVPVRHQDTTRAHELWQKHYQRAAEQCNTHEQAVRYADLMIR